MPVKMRSAYDADIPRSKNLGCVARGVSRASLPSQTTDQDVLASLWALLDLAQEILRTP